MSKNKGNYIAAQERRNEIGLRRNGRSGSSMEKEQVPEQPPMRLTPSSRETEWACLALVETEIEVAFSFLRLAEVETQGGNGEDAAELIAKAVATHNLVLQYVEHMRAGFEAEKRQLSVEAGKLFEAIGAVKQLKRQSELTDSRDQEEQVQAVYVETLST